MIALELAFPAGRFHATPWDRAVNEGDIEWPPSPWRILRAIVAGWYVSTSYEPNEMAEREIEGVLDRLSSAPRYVLPPGIASHTRHFVPLGNLERSLILDAFIAIDREALAYVVWDSAALGGDLRATLERACAGITYLGRAESWCHVRVVDEVPADEDRILVDLYRRTSSEGPEVRRLGVDPDFAGAGLLDALRTSTATMRKMGKATPEGSTWLTYSFPPGYGLAPSAPLRARRHHASPLPNGGGLRFAVEARTSALRPPVAETLTVAEAFRAAAMSHYSRRNDNESVPPELSGKARERPLDGHRHAYILPRDLDDDGRIDHIDVWFREGPVDHRVFVALTGISKLYSYRLGDEHFPVTYLGAALVQAARVWTSVTPFLLGAHPAARAASSLRPRFEPRAQVARSLREHGIELPASIQVHDGRPATLRHTRGGETTLSSFRSTRKHDRAIGIPLKVTLEFPEETPGPIAIGRYAHFGMGQFAPGG